MKWNEQIASVVDDAKTLLKIDDTSEDAVLTIWAKYAHGLIVDYCNQPQDWLIPDSLLGVWAQLIAIKYAVNKDGKIAGVDTSADGKVSSVTDGSQSVSYGTSPSASGGAFKAGISTDDDDLLTGFTAQLDRYRRLQWGMD